MSLLDVAQTALNVVAKLPPEARKGFGEALLAILNGDAATAARKARIAAETIAAREAIRAPYRARGRKL